MYVFYVVIMLPCLLIRLLKANTLLSSTGDLPILFPFYLAISLIQKRCFVFTHVKMPCNRNALSYQKGSMRRTRGRGLSLEPLRET